MLYQLLFLSAVLVLSSIQFDVFLAALHKRLRGYTNRLDTPKDPLYMSKSPILFGVVQILHFLKGYGLPFLAVFYFDDEILTTVTVALTLICHIWSPFAAFRPRVHVHMVLWGILTWLFPWLGVVYPIVFAVTMLIGNTFVLAGIANTLIAFVCIGYFQLDTVLFPINFILFLTVFIAEGPKIFSFFEQGGYTLYDVFDRRHVA